MKVRTREDIESVMEVAKLDPSDHLPFPQALYFSESLNTTEYVVFELDDLMVDDLKCGDVLNIKGQEDDNAVLCTKSKTFDIREAETSNSILYVDNLKVYDKNSASEMRADDDDNVEEYSVNIGDVVFMQNTYFELKECIPNMDRLKELLNECPYLGVVEEQDAIERGILEKRYTRAELVNSVQASEEELDEGIRALKAVRIDDYVRVLSGEYENEVVQAILNLIEEMSWSRANVPLDQCCLELSNLHLPQVVNQILKYYSIPNDDEEDTSYVCIDENAVCRQLGENLLRHTVRFHLDDFLKVWQEVVPEGIRVSLKQLEGIALIDQSSQPKSIWLFRAIDLPNNVDERFTILFEKKSHWKLEEISPYLRDICPGGTTAITSLLNKYSRTSTIKGKRFYTSKSVK